MNDLWSVGKETELISFTITETEIVLYEQLLTHSDLPENNELLKIPYTYPSLFWQYFKIPWLKKEEPIILVEQTFLYENTLLCDLTYTAKIVLTKVKKFHDQTFLFHDLYVYLQDKKQMTMKCTFLLKE